MSNIVPFPDQRKRLYLERRLASLDRERANIVSVIAKEGDTHENIIWVWDWYKRHTACAEELRALKGLRYG
jgi:hypothetical protein